MMPVLSRLADRLDMRGPERDGARKALRAAMFIPIAAAYPCVAVPLRFVVGMPITVLGLLSGVAAALPLVTTAASIGELELAYPTAAYRVPN